jgi:hypothetical protein
MLKKTIKYEDYNGLEREEDFYFNLTRAELVEMETGTDGGFTDKIQRIYRAKDTPAMMKAFKDIIMRAYGEKSDDGRRFEKSNELSIAFTQTPAYDKLIDEFMNDDQAAANFMNGIIPADVRDKAAEMLGKSEIKN